MRLTLRTLLAYMDGLLDPKDSQEIGKKIEDSKFATELFHKIRDVMRRLRLAAPSITERAANLDCNTVAEYLDNALPADRVPDFEEVSLKSEMHLAEVASCHQILTMVLGEPAEIDPESRQRMYQLPTVANRVDEERLAAVEAASMLSGDGSAAVPPAPPVKVRPRPVVPEYLRDPPKKSRLLPAAAIMLLVGAAIGLLLLMLGQFNAGTPLGNALQWVQAKMHGKPADDEERDDGDGKKSAKPSERRLPPESPDRRAAAPKSSEAAPAAPANESALPALPKTAAIPRQPPARARFRFRPSRNRRREPGSRKPPVPAARRGRPAARALPPAGVATTPTAPETKPGAGEKSPVPSVARPRLESGRTEDPARRPRGRFSAGEAARRGRQDRSVRRRRNRESRRRQSAPPVRLPPPKTRRRSAASCRTGKTCC